MLVCAHCLVFSDTQNALFFSLPNIVTLYYIIHYSPYKDGFALTAQILSVLAFLLSLAGVSGAVLALFTLVLFLSSCCCTMNKCGLITAGVFGLLTAAVLVFFAIAIPLNMTAHETELRHKYGDAFYDAILHQIKIRTYLMMAGAILWTLASILVFIFACTSRYERMVGSYQEVETNETEEETAEKPTTTETEAETTTETQAVIV